ncbi:MAG: ATP-binding protein [Candidatus Omnitrophota bacterium]
MQLNYYSIGPFFSSLLSFTTGFLVLKRNPKGALHQRFFLLCFFTTMWLLPYSVNYNLNVNHLPLIEKIFRYAYCSVMFIPISLLHYLLLCFNTKKYKLFIYFSYLYGLVISFLIIKTNHIISGTYLFYWGFYPKAGEFNPYVLICFSFYILAIHSLLIYELRKAHPGSIEKNQIKYQLIAFLIFGTGSLDFVPNYGYPLLPVGYIQTSISLCILSYAIIKHKLLNINLIIRKGLLYSTLASIISITYLITIFLIESFVRDFIGYKSISISTSIAFFLGLVFIPLKDKIQYIIDKAFYKGSTEEIAQENLFLRKEIADKERLKAIATLASGLAHEIKNPLTAVKTFTEYLPSKKNDPQFLDKFARIVNNEVGRIDNLVNQLLDFAKPAPLNLKNTDAGNLIDDTLAFLNNDFIKHSISIVKKYNPNEHHLLKIDHNQFKQALLNLFLNAIEAMPLGGELIIGINFIKEGNPSSADILCISIKDTGQGIAKEDLKHIFDPFFSKKDTGTGLGLAITQGIIQEHGGKISVETQSGVGTEFKIEIPFKYS